MTDADAAAGNVFGDAGSGQKPAAVVINKDGVPVGDAAGKGIRRMNFTGFAPVTFGYDAAQLTVQARFRLHRHQRERSGISLERFIGRS